MSVTPPPELPRIKARLPFEARPFGGAMRRGAVWMHAMLATGLGALAYYMGVVKGQPLTSPNVLGPAIGAAWFGLRLFMTLRPKD